jgi:hypothetical protein
MIDLKPLELSHPLLYPLIAHFHSEATKPHNPLNPPKKPQLVITDDWRSIPDLIESHYPSVTSDSDQHQIRRAISVFTHRQHIPHSLEPIPGGGAKLYIHIPSLSFSLRHNTLPRAENNTPLGIGFYFNDGITPTEATQCFPNAWPHFTRHHTSHLPSSSWRHVASVLPKLSADRVALFSRTAFHSYLTQRARSNNLSIPTDILLSPHVLTPTLV